MPNELSGAYKGYLKALADDIIFWQTVEDCLLGRKPHRDEATNIIDATARVVPDSGLPEQVVPAQPRPLQARRANFFARTRPPQGIKIR